MNKYGRLKARISAVEVLMLMKEAYTYRELSSTLKLPVPVLSRYVNGHVLPGFERSEQISEVFFEKHLRELVKKMLRLEDGVFDDSAILGNPILLDKISKAVAPTFANLGVNRVLTVEVDGIPVATHMAKELGVQSVVAKGRKEMGIRSFIEVKRIHRSGTYTYLYVPKYAIQRGDRILIVDDVVRTGSTVETLLNICRASATTPAGFFTLIGLRNAVARLRNSLDIPVHAFLEI